MKVLTIGVALFPGATVPAVPLRSKSIVDEWESEWEGGLLTTGLHKSEAYAAEDDGEQE